MVIISNGFNKFHLSVAAAETSKRGLLSSFITGAYPTPSVRKILALPGLKSSRKLQRLNARFEPIPDTLLRPSWWAEGRFAIAALVQKHGRNGRGHDVPGLAAHKQYGREAARFVREAATRGARIYHYRSGFGHDSVRVAKDLGLFTLCDHSAPHPAIFDFLINNNGRFPPSGEPTEVSSFWSDVLDDINQADAVLANSSFVERTFLHEQYTGRIHIVYLGVDDALLTAIPNVSPRGRCDGPLRMLFAGFFCRGKGALDLIRASRHELDGVTWELQIAGDVERQLLKENTDFFRDRRVKTLGLLSRRELAEVMVQAEVFIFPSLAEGSARVIFEALACGCYVITTPNSGSIVQNGVHGALVPPGDANALAAAIREAFADRARLLDIGHRNSQLIRGQYRQRSYGEKLASLYALIS